MTSGDGRSTPGTVHVRYWAAAKAAAGVAEDALVVHGTVTLAEVVQRVVELHTGRGLAQVVGVCSVLLGDLPVSTDEPSRVLVPPGSRVEFLPPFAGG